MLQTVEVEVAAPAVSQPTLRSLLSRKRKQPLREPRRRRSISNVWLHRWRIWRRRTRRPRRGASRSGGANVQRSLRATLLPHLCPSRLHSWKSTPLPLRAAPLPTPWIPRHQPRAPLHRPATSSLCRPWSAQVTPSDPRAARPARKVKVRHADGHEPTKSPNFGCLKLPAFASHAAPSCSHGRRRQRWRRRRWRGRTRRR